MQRNRLHPRRRAASGFTLIEVLTVCVILGILTGLVFVAFKGISGTAGGQATGVRLGNAKSLLAEYELTQKLSDLDSDLNNNGNKTDGPPTDFERVQLPSGNGPFYYQETAPGLVTPDGGGDRYAGAANTAVRRSQIVMGRLLAVPANRKAITSLPADALLEPTGTTTSLDLDGGVFKPPVLLDSYKNPILYVPAGGLVGVAFGKDKDPNAPFMRITTRGVVATTAAPPAGSRPFFASAGADGNFATGDDNIYSFSN